jgi:hypothetical protein
MIVFPKILADECVDRRLIEEKKKLLLSVLQHHSDKLIGNFSVLTKDKLRIRKQEI